MESYREKLKLQNVVFAIGCVALALFSVLGFLGEAGVVKLAPSVGDGHWQSRWRGFISGASFGILVLLLTGLIREMRRRWPDCAITLSLGERTEASYRALFEAGANRYLLRHETITPDHYRWLHPVRMSLDHRIECLHTLKKIGYQTGTGIMVGSPGQTVDDLVRDLLFIREFEPQMIGIGPFIPHRDTPFGHEPAGSVERTLTLLSILRLMCPAALIPSTTALATLSGNGRMRGILAGANVVMPNLSPPDERSKYNLYDGKAAFGAEAAEGLAALERELNEIGRHISWSRGDYQE